jgi:cytochrome b involved in lipid metabolism
MKNSISLIASFVLALSAISHPIANGAKNPAPGATCTKLKATQVYKGKKYTCIKSGKKLIWNKGVPVVVKPTASPSLSPSPVISQTPTPTPTPTPSPTPSPTKAGYTMDQVRANNSNSSCWSVIDGFVYDLTRWITSHPGGAGAIRSLCGVDGTSSFKAQHSNQSSPAQRLNSYLLGPLSK